MKTETKVTMILIYFASLVLSFAIGHEHGAMFGVDLENYKKVHGEFRLKNKGYRFDKTVRAFR
jgi:hypothetical protein